MSTETRTALAAILRKIEQGLISEADAYHMICEVVYRQFCHK